jgi:hypothetical protein
MDALQRSDEGVPASMPGERALALTPVTPASNHRASSSAASMHRSAAMPRSMCTAMDRHPPASAFMARGWVP